MPLGGRARRARHCGCVAVRERPPGGARCDTLALPFAPRLQDRDPSGLVGGWAGGEKELKDWAAVPFSAIDPKLRGALKGGKDVTIGKRTFKAEDMAVN